MNSFILVAAFLLGTGIIASDGMQISEISLKSSSILTPNNIAIKKEVKSIASKKVISVNVPLNENATNTSHTAPNVKSTTDGCPYTIASNQEIWEQWCSVCRTVLSGNELNSQSKEYKDFFRSATVRLANSKIIDLGIDYDYINDIVLDEKEGGIAKIGFDYDAKQGIYYSSMYPWERNMGFCMEYDAIAPYVSDKLDTKRFKFNYNGFEWMIQVWKGQYGGVSIGAEIGTYYRKPNAVYPTPSFYYCVPDDMMLDVQMDFYYKDNLLFKRPMQKNWWLTGFVFLQTCKPEETKVDAKIIFPNEEMLIAFLGALESYGYVNNETYTVDNTTVSFTY